MSDLRGKKLLAVEYGRVRLGLATGDTLGIAVTLLGFIRRETWEINASKIESVEVDQSIFGRLLGYGTVVVKGTGGGTTPMKLIADPIAFRNHITAR